MAALEFSSVQLAIALTRWRNALSNQYVLTGSDVLDRYGRSSSATGTQPAAVLRPGSVAEVESIVSVARQTRVPLYPLSAGKNWGYGDACAVFSGQVIVDLGRMNRIIEVNTELAYAVIEPGVTQRQLSDYLRQHDIPLWLDCTGSSPQTSLIGNILERGFGHSPYGNRTQHIAALEVVLGSGKRLHTGAAHFKNSKVHSVYPYGIGPSLDGLFAQSSFGIVTRLSFWLMPKPEAFCPFLCFIDSDERLTRLVERLRVLKQDGTLTSTAHIANDLRALTGMRDFPRQLAPDSSRLSEPLRQRLRHEARLGAWVISGALYGSREHVGSGRRRLRRALRQPGVKLVFFPDKVLRLGAAVARLTRPVLPALANKVQAAQALADLHRGIPSANFLRGAYWRHRSGAAEPLSDDSDIAQDGCGILWLAPVIPMRGADLERLNTAMETVFYEYGFDYLATLSMVNARSLAAIITVSFDAANAAEVVKAKACYQAGWDKAMALGYIPYRAGIQSQAAGDLARHSDGTFWPLVRHLKRVFDPDNIIAPGRYLPEVKR